ncbi:MAG: cache domain-containing protein, partial [Chloroflexi bacterium]|nr:cache domain-containing protein [Chloroflexota bacterium]
MDTPVSIPFSRSLSGRLLLLLLGLTALPALLIGGLAYRNARQTIEDRVVAQLTSVADLKKEQIASWLENRVADSRLLADNFLNEEHFTFILDPDSDPKQSAAFAAFLTDNLLSVQQARDGYSEIFFADTAGKIILSTDASRLGASAADYAAVALTLASPTGEYIEDIHREAGSGQIEMAFGHALHKVDLNTNTILPEVNGVVVIRVRMDETLYPLLREWPGMGGTGETLLVR